MIATVEERVSQTAAELGVQPEQMQVYTVELDWVRDNGVLVSPHVKGTGLLTTKINIEQLGLREDDPRVHGLKNVRRQLVNAHPAAHHIYHQRGETIYGFSPEMGPPPAVYLRQGASLNKLEYLTPTGWLPYPIEPYQIAAQADENGGFASSWIELAASDLDWPAVEVDGADLETPGPDYETHTARWLRLTWSAGGKMTEEDTTIDPHQQLKSIEARARASTDMTNSKGTRGYGQKLLGYGDWWWIGKKAWQAWQTDWQHYEQEMACLKAYLCWRWPELHDGLHQRLEVIAKLAWQALDDKGQEKKVDFCGRVVDEGLGRLPTPEVIDRKVTLNYEVALIQAGADVERDRLERAELQAAREIAMERVATERLTEQTKREVIDAEARAMKRAVAEKAREQLAEVGSPLQQMVDNVRAMVYHKLAKAQQIMKEKGKLHHKTAAGLKLLVDQFRLLNSHDDDDLETQLTQLDAMLPKGAAVQGDAIGNLQTMVDDIVRLTAESAERVARRDVSDDFGTDQVRY